MAYFIKLLAILASPILFLSCTSSFEKKKLEFEKEKLAFEKEKLAFERLKLFCDKKNFSCLASYPPCKTKKSPCQPPKQTNQPDTKPSNNTTDCQRIPVDSADDIWKIAEKGGWSYSYYALKQGYACQGDKKESFYKSYTNSESYVAKTQVHKTKKSSCINNVLFSAKGKLYKLMIDKTARQTMSSSEQRRIDRGQSLRQIVTYNNRGKKRSFYYQCKPTDPGRQWNRCICVLFASHENGKSGLSKRLKDNLR